MYISPLDRRVKMIFVSLFITAIIAFLWLKSQGYRRIAIEGVSKGAEYALASAVTFNEISCLILKTPTWYYGEGLVKRAPSNTSSWSYKGEEFPYTPYKERAFKLKKDILFKKEYNIRSPLQEKSNKSTVLLKIQLFS